MKNTLIHILLIVGIICTSSVILSQGATDKIPNSDHPLWNDFAKCRFVRNEVKNLTSIGYSLEVRKLNNKTITISGFMTPLEASKKITHFLLNKNNPTCSFCPPSRPNEVIEVFTSTPIVWHDNIATFSGKLVLINDARERIFFKIYDARLE